MMLVIETMANKRKGFENSLILRAFHHFAIAYHPTDPISLHLHSQAVIAAFILIYTEVIDFWTLCSSSCQQPDCFECVRSLSHTHTHFH